MPLEKVIRCLVSRPSVDLPHHFNAAVIVLSEAFFKHYLKQIWLLNWDISCPAGFFLKDVCTDLHSQLPAVNGETSHFTPCSNENSISVGHFFAIWNRRSLFLFLPECNLSIQMACVCSLVLSQPGDTGDAVLIHTHLTKTVNYASIRTENDISGKTTSLTIDW